jgi:DNA-binding transcriptional LysR family regulator
MDLNEIAVFVKVMQAGSFSQAAKQLGMPNSTVSAKVASLENRLGVALLHRTTRKLHITSAGQAFFDRCLRGVQEIQGAEQELTSHQGVPRGSLRITAPSVLGSMLLPPIVQKFAADHPQLFIELVFVDRTVDLIAEGLDLAIRAGDLEDSTLIARKLGVSYFAPFASANYLKGHGTPVHPKDLANHQCIQFSHLDQSKWELVHKSKNKIAVVLSRRLVVDDLHFAKELAVLGGGIALLPTFLCETERTKKKLVRILPEWKTSVRPIHFVYPAQKFVSPAVQSFIATSTAALKTRLRDLEF